jgi:hypothetical protein
MAKTPVHSDVGALIASGQLVENILKHADNVEDTDAVEGALTVSSWTMILQADCQALEVFSSRCASELSPYVPQITSRALELIKYDPVGFA